VSDAALSGDTQAFAKRCGVVATDQVKELTTLLVLRFRFQIHSGKSEMLAEDSAVVAFRGMPASPQWLKEEEAELLMSAAPSGSIGPDQAKQFLKAVLAQHAALSPHLDRIARERADALLASHRRVRKALSGSHAARDIKVQGSPDVLGCYLLLPHGGGR
jgi:hypothetical protein